jgi:hypothetical protein
MPLTTLEYRLRIRDQTDSSNLLILSSRASDPNCLLTEEPSGDGQRIDWVEGTSEIGVQVWRAWDRDDGDDERTITSQLADVDARNQMLSNKCVGEYSRNSGAWTAFHTGYLNSIELIDAGTFEFTVGDTDRREQDAELFKTLTTTFWRGSYLIGGPIPHIDGLRPYNSPAVAFAGIKDYGPVRMQKVAATAGSNTIALELVSGYVRPYYDRLLTTIGADEVATINRLAAPWAVSTIGTGKYTGSGRLAWNDFPGLVIRMKRVSDGVTFDRMPVAVPTAAPTSGDNDRLVVGENMGLYVYWPAVQPVPDNGTQFDIWVYPNEVSERSPLHWAGNPVDLVTLAWTQEGVAYNAVAAAAVRSALSTLWVEFVFTKSMPLKDLVSKHVFGPFGVGARLNAANEKVLFLTRATAPASVDTVDETNIITDE